MDNFYVAPAVITIDPGIEGTGLAIWSMNEWAVETIPLATYVLVPIKGKDWVSAVEDLHYKIIPILEKHNVQKGYCEFPQYFTSAVGHAATAKGDIYKLSCLVGVFMGAMLSRKTNLILVQVNQWKGQLPKDVVISRLLRRQPRLAELNIKTHAWDAVGLAYYKKRIFSGIR